MIYLASYVGMMLLRLGRVRGAYAPLLVATFLFSAFRYEVGCDWGGYLNQYETFIRVPLDQAFAMREPLWTLLVISHRELGLPYPWLNVVSSAIFFFGLHRFARRQPDPLALVILLFPVLVLNMPMSGIRQGAAIGIMFLAWNAFVDRSTLRFVLFVLIAGGLHSSAVLFLLLAPLAGGGMSRRRLLLSAVLAVPGALLLLSSGAGEVATTRYLNTGMEANGALYRLLLLQFAALPLLFSWGRTWRQRFPDEHRLVVIGSLGMVASLVLLPVSSVIADRIGYYFVPIQAMIFARIPQMRLGASRAFMTGAPYLLLLVLLSGWVLLSRHFEICYLPYRSWILGLPGGM